MIDTNVFVAAIKLSSRRNGKWQVKTDTLKLIGKLITDDRLELVGNSRLIDEYTRLAAELQSATSGLILKRLVQKIRNVEVDEKALLRCKPYIPPRESADVLHAATSLQTGAILITNDRDFDVIGRSGIIQVWSVNEAIKRLLNL